MLPEEIKMSWKANANEAAARGTWLHLELEVLLNGGSVPYDNTEIQLFADFLRSSAQLLAFRTEWCIFGEEEKLAGCIDFVAMDGSGQLILFDWKRTKQLRQKQASSWGRMQPPLSHLDDCAGVHYHLQLNLYKFLLQKYYSCRVGAMYVVGLHPDNASLGLFADSVPDMTAEVEAMRQLRREALAAKAPTDDHEICAQEASTCPGFARSDFEPGLAWSSSGAKATGDLLATCTDVRLDISGGSQSQCDFDARVDEELEGLMDEQPGDAEDTVMVVALGDPVDATSQLALLDGQAGETQPHPHQEAKRRRLMPGADVTAAAFDRLFTDAARACRESLASMPEPAVDESCRTIFNERIAMCSALENGTLPGQRIWCELLLAQ